MAKEFVDAVKKHFSEPTNGRFLILGDHQHGAASLLSLANAVAQGRLDLQALRIKAILFEGARKGQEATFGKGQYNNAFQVLRKQVSIVQGCEDNDSLSSEAEILKLIELGAAGQAPPNAQSRQQELMDRRMPDANTAWAKALDLHSKAILCCGTSHLAQFGSELGLVKRASFKGSTAGYTIEKPNSNAGDDLYYPEWSGQGPKKFTAVEAIQPYPGVTPGINPARDQTSGN